MIEMERKQKEGRSATRLMSDMWRNLTPENKEKYNKLVLICGETVGVAPRPTDVPDWCCYLRRRPIDCDTPALWRNGSGLVLLEHWPRFTALAPTTTQLMMPVVLPVGTASSAFS